MLFCHTTATGYGQGKAPVDTFTRFTMHVPLSSKEPAIQWFYAAYHICFPFIVLYINQAIFFSIEMFYISHPGLL